MATRDLRLPNELLCHICAFAVAEYIDSLVAGSLRIPLVAGASIARTDPARAAHNPLIQLFQTSHALHDATLTAVSDALAIPTIQAGRLRRLAVNPWARIQPMRMLMYNARSQSLRSAATPQPLRVTSVSPLLQHYERVALLIAHARSLPHRGLLLSEKTARETASALSADSDSDSDSDISVTVVNDEEAFDEGCDLPRMCEEIEVCDFPEGQEALGAFVRRRCAGVLFLYTYVRAFVNAIWMTHCRGEKLPLSVYTTLEKKLLEVMISQLLQTVIASLDDEDHQWAACKTPLYNEDDWDLGELLDMADLEPSEPVPHGDLPTRLRWGLEQLKSDLEKLKTALREEQHSEYMEEIRDIQETLDDVEATLAELEARAAAPPRTYKYRRRIAATVRWFSGMFVGSGRR